MTDKVKQIFNWLSLKWIRIAEIIVVAWAINGMWQNGMWQVAKPVRESPGIRFDFGLEYGVGFEYYPLILFLFYPVSAVLILYLLRKYERKN